MTHTPGPWLIAGATHIYASGKNGANVCSISEPRATTEVRYTPLALGSNDREEAYANARLIAAAPDMLKALRKLTTEITSNQTLMDNISLRVFEEAVEAIGKALGEQP